MTTTIQDCKIALDDLRRRFSNADGEAMLAKFGVRRVADIPEELRSMFQAACEGGANSAIVAGLGGKIKASTDDVPADFDSTIAEVNRQGARNDEAARQWHEDAKQARAKGEPVPPLPPDEHNARIAERMKADREAAKEIGAGFWKK